MVYRGFSRVYFVFLLILFLPVVIQGEKRFVNVSKLRLRKSPSLRSGTTMILHKLEILKSIKTAPAVLTVQDDGQVYRGSMIQVETVHGIRGWVFKPFTAPLPSWIKKIRKPVQKVDITSGMIADAYDPPVMVAWFHKNSSFEISYTANYNKAAVKYSGQYHYTKNGRIVLHYKDGTTKKWFVVLVQGTQSKDYTATLLLDDGRIIFPTLFLMKH